ncbi:MAG: BlaI/MecI/CopY family transcriptional regulator [Clostridia bacterium]
MIRLTDSEWKVLEVLWENPNQTLGQILANLKEQTAWSRNTVHTYLTRMTAKDLVCHDTSSPKKYSANITRELAANSERKGLMDRFYKGSASNLVASFVKDGELTKDEIEELKKLLDGMEV